MPTHYETLGVDRNADDKAIRKAYLARALETHPDKHPGKEAEFKVVKDAYDILSDSDKKAAYDATLPQIKVAASPRQPSVAKKYSKSPTTTQGTGSFASRSETPSPPQESKTITQAEFISKNFSALPDDLLTNFKFQHGTKDWTEKADIILNILSDKYLEIREKNCGFFPKGANFFENALLYAQKNLNVPKNTELNDIQKLWIVLKYAESKPNDRTAKALSAVIEEHATPPTSTNLPGNRS